jgi:hypothetical protein
MNTNQNGNNDDEVDNRFDRGGNNGLVSSQMREAIIKIDWMMDPSHLFQVPNIS